MLHSQRRSNIFFFNVVQLGMSLSTQEKLMVPGVTGDSKDKEAKVVYDNLILRYLYSTWVCYFKDISI
ncbi:hypothetical protein LXL04_019948 [Taraxacum kok-saghyz]